MADEIKVNATEWNNLTYDDQEKIKSILSATGLFKGNMSIRPDPTTRAVAAGLGGVGAQPESIFCKIACDFAETAAIAACAITPVPQICKEAAHAAADFCREQC